MTLLVSLHRAFLFGGFLDRCVVRSIGRRVGVERVASPGELFRTFVDSKYVHVTGTKVLIGQPVNDAV